MTVCLCIWDDLVKKGVYENWYHPDSLMVCLRIGMTLWEGCVSGLGITPPGVLQ